MPKIASIVVASVAALVTLPLPALAQRAASGRTAMASLPLELLARRDVQDELELVSDQQMRIRALREEVRGRMRGAIVQLRPGDNAREQLREVVSKMNEEVDVDLAKILLPHQVDRLKQLRLQLQLRAGPVAVFFNPTVADSLSIDATKLEELRRKGGDVELEYRRKLADLRREMQEQMLQLLSPEQQNQFRRMIGDPFEFEQEPTVNSVADDDNRAETP